MLLLLLLLLLLDALFVTIFPKGGKLHFYAPLTLELQQLEVVLHRLEHGSVTSMAIFGNYDRPNERWTNRPKKQTDMWVYSEVTLQIIYPLIFPKEEVLGSLLLEL